MAAENPDHPGHPRAAALASMRPRRMAAENVGDGHRLARQGRRASMRPRRMAAENRLDGRSVRGHVSRFNEAAAHGRGKRGLSRTRRPGPRASMRPRRMAAENTGRARHRVSSSRRASMRPRRMAAENAAGPFAPPAPERRFNEAAAHGRGKRDRRGGPRPGRGPASMRPRRMAAENAVLLPDRVSGAAASMRPRRMAAENRGQRRRRRLRSSAASMRPRRMAAENRMGSRGAPASRGRFNEAAAHGRGKPDARAASANRPVGLQ